jgi:uncharacterized NAD(P)/FAD-binding protein YdhS
MQPPVALSEPIPAPTPTAIRTIALIGGGFSTLSLLLSLRRQQAGAQLRVVVFEPRAQLGGGLAYSPWELGGWGPLLNVPAGRMGAVSGDEQGFARWWVAQGGTAHGFAPRAAYGRYLAACAAQCMAQSEPGDAARFEHRRQAVRRLRRGANAWELGLDDGSAFNADAAVLACGPASRDRPIGPWGEPGWVLDPWVQGEQLDALPSHAPVLLLGSGLSAVDVWQRLSLRRPSGPVLMLSRHGWLPQAHRDREHPPRPGLLPTDVLSGMHTAGALLRGFRRLQQELSGQGLDWRDVMADLRAHTPRLWQQLPAVEQRRALRHLQALWDSHRHRLAPAVSVQLQAALQSGALRTWAGRLLKGEVQGKLWRLDVQTRGGERRQLDAVAVVNCTGPAPPSCAAADPLLEQAYADGTLQRHANGLGPSCDASGRPLTASGATQPGLWLLGPLLRARDWEASAVPELREHPSALAARLVAEAEHGFSR